MTEVIRITPGARRYLVSRGYEAVVLTYTELEVGDSIGVAKEVTITYEPPEDRERYRLFPVDDIEVFVDRRLRADGDVVIKKQGFWKLTSLYADGFRIPI